MATEGGRGLAVEVAAAFVEQYFHILGHVPHEARKLYVDDSVISRPAPDGTMLSFTSVEAINKHILSCDYEGTTFDLVSVDSQISLENGIFIMVIGFFTGKDNLKKKFSQLFYLALQNNTYVLLNDIFRFLDNVTSPLVILPAIESVPPTEMAKPAGELKSSEPASEVKNDVATPPLENGKINPSDAAQKPKETVVETVAPQPDGTKRSFAAIVQSLARNDAPFQVKAPAQKPKHTGQARATAAPQAHAAQAPAAVRNSGKKNVQKIIEEPGTSIFVSNLPMNAMPPQLYELLKDFGHIKKDGIQVRSSRAKGICFGFVAFESAESVQSVLEAAKNSPFVLAERKLHLKEKKVEYDGIKPTGGKSGGGTQNGSADGKDEFRQNRNRRNGGRNERKGERIVIEDNNQKSNGASTDVKA